MKWGQLESLKFDDWCFRTKYFETKHICDNFPRRYGGQWTPHLMSAVATLIHYLILSYQSLAYVPIVYPLKTPENRWLSVVFRGHKTGPLGIIQKVRHSGMGGGEINKKSDENDIGKGRAAKKVMPLTQKFLMLFFAVTRFFILCISWSPDNIIVSNNKNIFKRLSLRLR